MDTTGEFHWTGSWYFMRMPDGAVRIRNTSLGGVVAVIPANEWASIVCSVSKLGEDGERWNAAQDFHGRPPSPQEIVEGER